MNDTTKKKERAVLAGLSANSMDPAERSTEESMEELAALAETAGAEVVGAGICIEKAFQPGGDRIRARGVRVESLARIKSMDDEGHIEFC